jgi:hypothetical protein
MMYSSPNPGGTNPLLNALLFEQRLSTDYMKSLLYVSESNIGFSHAKDRLSDIVDYSRWWNASVGITGALVFTEKHFVQFIEGADTAIDDMLIKLNSDSRHVNVVVIESVESHGRYFGQWDLAYSGPDDYIDRQLMCDIQQGSHQSGTIRAEGLRSSLLRMAFHK